jgi:hypothetical protein
MFDSLLSLFRYKAEIDFDGRELARSYLKRQDLSALLEAAKQIQTEQAGKVGNLRIYFLYKF